MNKGGKYFFRDKGKIAAIVNIAKEGDAYTAIPNYPCLEFCKSKGPSPEEAFLRWHQNHRKHIYSFFMNN